MGKICFILSVSFFVKGEIFDCIVALKVLSVARNYDMTAKHPIKQRDNVCLEAAAGFKATLADRVTKSETRARECAWVFLQTLYL